MDPNLSSETRESFFSFNKRIMLVSSDRIGWFDTATDREHFEKRPYSVGAIFYELSLRGWKTQRAGLLSSANLLTLAKRIDAFCPSIVYTYGATTALNPLICRRFLCKWRAFHIIHGWDDAYGDIGGNLFGFPGRILMNILEKQIVKRSDQVITLSRFLQKKAQAWGIDCHYIPNGADEPIFDRSTCSIKLSGRFNLVYTGDQAKWKRTSEICDAMRDVPKDVKLYLTGQHYRYLDKYASDNCIFLGYLSKNDQFCVMDQADALVCTADQDCNAKLQEYVRFKKPVLGYDGRLNLFFKNGRNALLTRDYPTAIMRLYTTPELCHSLVKNAQADIPVYTWKEIASQFEAYVRYTTTINNVSKPFAKRKHFCN